MMEIDEFDPILHEIKSTIKLDIGSGGPEFQRTDYTWKTVDKYAPAIYQVDMWDLPFEDNTVDAIWSSHALEHITRAQVLPTLVEWYRVLKHDAPCTILVPDMDYVASLWLEHGMAALEYVFGNQRHEGEFHKTGWNIDALQADMEYSGFKVVEIKSIWTPAYTQNSIRVDAKKP